MLDMDAWVAVFRLRRGEIDLGMVDRVEALDVRRLG
jgi:hypothetical protein